jgi:hypothetical protein
MIVVALSLAHLPTTYRPFQTGWRDAGQLLESQMRAGEVLVIAPQDQLGDVVTVYAALRRYAPGAVNADRTVVLLSGPADPALTRPLAARGAVTWVITQYPNDTPQQILDGARPVDVAPVSDTINLGALWRVAWR